jgi:hypothetical protein
MPNYSTGKTCGFPLNNKTYEVVDWNVVRLSKRAVNSIQFSTYFEGYGLYEDADFSIRITVWQNVINTSSVKTRSIGRP